MVTVCTQVLADNTGFYSSARALAVTNLCFSDTLCTVAGNDIPVRRKGRQSHIAAFVRFEEIYHTLFYMLFCYAFQRV